jgi:hypothetical protein
LTTLLDPKVEIVFSNSLCFKKKGINVCCEDVILDNLKTAMDTCMINQHDVCLLLNKDDKVLVVIQDVIQKEALWNDHVRNLRIEGVLVNQRRLCYNRKYHRIHPPFQTKKLTRNWLTI